jgi:hypothetical protein
MVQMTQLTRLTDSIPDALIKALHVLSITKKKKIIWKIR